MADGSTISITPPAVTIVQAGLTPVSGCTATITRHDATEVDTEEVSTYWRYRRKTTGYANGNISFRLVVPTGCRARWSWTGKSTGGGGYWPEDTELQDIEGGFSGWYAAGTYDITVGSGSFEDLRQVTTYYQDSSLEDEDHTTTGIRVYKATGITVEVRKIRVTVNLTFHAWDGSYPAVDITSEAGMTMSPPTSPIVLEAGDTKTVTVTIANRRVEKNGQVWLFAYWSDPSSYTWSYGLSRTVNPEPYDENAGLVQTIVLSLSSSVNAGYDGRTENIQSNAYFNEAVVISVSACPACGDSGIVKGTQEIPWGSSCEVEAQDTPTAKFRRWLQDRGTYKSVVSRDKVYRLSYVYDAVSLIAEFVCLNGNLLANGSSSLVVNDSKTALVVAS